MEEEDMPVVVLDPESTHSDTVEEYKVSSNDEEWSPESTPTRKPKRKVSTGRKRKNAQEKNTEVELELEGIPKPRKSQYIRKFRREWLADPRFSSWLRESVNSTSKIAACKVCNSNLSGSETHLVRHGTTAKHLENFARSGLSSLNKSNISAKYVVKTEIDGTLEYSNSEEPKKKKLNVKVEGDQQPYRKFSSKWLQDPRFSEWIQESKRPNEKTAFCKVCHCELTGGATVLERHSNTRKHLKKLALLKDNQPVSPDQFDSSDDENHGDDDHDVQHQSHITKTDLVPVNVDCSTQSVPYIIHIPAEYESEFKLNPTPTLRLSQAGALRRFIPLFDRVLIQKAEAITRTSSGILIPERSQAKVLTGKVVAVGEGGRTEAGQVIPPAVAVGDEVMLPEFGGTRVTLEENDYFLFRDTDLLAKFKSE